MTRLTTWCSRRGSPAALADRRWRAESERKQAKEWCRPWVASRPCGRGKPTSQPRAATTIPVAPLPRVREWTHHAGPRPANARRCSVYPRAFHYVRATSLEHAVALLGEYGDEARPLAGGASLIPLLKLRLAAPTVLVDVGRLDALAGIARRDGHVAVGAVTRHVEVEDDAALAAALPLLHDVAAGIGDAQVRNMGTVGGGLAEADPAGDWGPALLAVGGSVRAVGPGGERVIPAA